jgi:hypothetical protein
VFSLQKDDVLEFGRGHISSFEVDIMVLNVPSKVKNMKIPPWT